MIHFVVNTDGFFWLASVLTPSPDLDDSPHCSNQTARQITAHQGDPMAVRLIVTITAAAGKGSELGKLYKARCEDIVNEPGCEQFEVFQSVVNPDHLVILERWTDQAALDVHSKVNATRAPLPAELRVGTTQREDYTYNRTR